MVLRLAALAFSALLLTQTAGAAEALRWWDLPEFGVRVAFVRTWKVDRAESGTHLHGWYAPVTPSKQVGRSIGIWADWNAVPYASPEEAAFCPENGGSLDEGAKLGLTFPGHRSVTCVEPTKQGGVLVTVTTQAWLWGEGFGDEANKPLNNYYARLTTTPQALTEDLRSFRSFLENVQLREPER